MPTPQAATAKQDLGRRTMGSLAMNVRKWVGEAVTALWLPAASVAILIVAVRATLAGA